MNIPFIHDRMAELVYKEMTNSLSTEEAIELKNIINSSPAKRKLYDELMDPEIMKREVKILLEVDVEESWKKFKADYPEYFASLKKLTIYNFFLRIRQIIQDLLH